MEKELKNLAKISDAVYLTELLAEIPTDYLINERDQQGNTLSHLAALEGNSVLLNRLNSQQALCMNIPNSLGETPLHLAVMSNSVDVLRCFLELGSSLTLTDENGDSPLHLAARHNRNEVTEFIATSGFDIQIKNGAGETALHVAAKLNHRECVIALTAAGIDLNARTNKCETSLLLAAKAGHSEIVKILLNHGANPNLCDDDYMSPLHFTAKLGDAISVRALLRHGGNSTLLNKHGIMPCVAAFAQGHNEIGKILLKMTPEKCSQSMQQLTSRSSPINRIEVKLFGSQMTGKTALSASIRSGYISGYFRRKIKALSDFTGWTKAKDGYSENNYNRDTDFLCLESMHEDYTRGIDLYITQELSIWEFSGYEPYYFLYDFFIGNISCIHVVVFSLMGTGKRQGEDVRFWLEFIENRFPVYGEMFWGPKPRVVVVATHADRVNCLRDSEGCLYHAGAARLLQDVRREYRHRLDIAEELHIVDANAPNSIELKFLRQSLMKLRQNILPEVPPKIALSDTILHYLEETESKNLPNFVRWQEFYKIVEQKFNPLCEESDLRNIVQALQYTSNIIVLETEDANDFIVLKPIWLLSEVIGNLFSEDTFRLARVTGSFTLDDLHFLLADEKADQLVMMLEAIECCTVCSPRGDEVKMLPGRRQSIEDFYENAAASSAMVAEAADGMAEELQFEFTRLNHLPPASECLEELTRLVDCRSAALQFRAPLRQLVHLFPRIQCRLRRTVLSIEDYVAKKQEDIGQSDYHEAQVSPPELINWLHGSKIILSGGCIQATVTCEENQEAIRIRVECTPCYTEQAFGLLFELYLQVRLAFHEICPRMLYSNDIVMLSLEDGREREQIAPTEVLFHLNRRRVLQQVEDETHRMTSQDICEQDLTVFGHHLFLGDACLMAKYCFGEELPARSLQSPLLYHVYCLLVMDDGMSAKEASQFTERLFNFLDGVNAAEAQCDDSNIQAQIAEALLTWHHHDGARLGHLLTVLESINRIDVSQIVIYHAPLFVCKDVGSFNSPCKFPC